MQRRDFTGLLLSLTTGSILSPLLSKGAGLNINPNTLNLKPISFADTGLPANLPENIKVLIRNVLKAEFKSVNTDWDGTIQIEGLLRFAARGFKEGLDYASNWFNYHVEHDGKLTDDEYYKQYDGPKARILRDGPLTFVIYSANLGVAFPVYELYRQTNDPKAKQVCFDVADAILHYAARGPFRNARA